jgi:hypothetical protein
MRPVSLLLVSLVPLLALAEEPAKPLLLVAGMQTTLNLKYEPCVLTEECIRMGNKALVELQYSKEKHQVIITPVQRGETTLTIRDERGDIKDVYNLLITNINLPRYRDELAALLHSIRGINVKITGDLIVVDGEIDDLNGLNRLNTALSTSPYSEITKNMVIMSDSGIKKLAQQIQGEINRPSVTVRDMNHSFVIEGKVENEKDASHVVSIANQVVHTFKRLQPEPMVMPRLTWPGK